MSRQETVIKHALVKLREHGVMGLAHRVLDTPKIRAAAPIPTQRVDAAGDEKPLVYCLTGSRSITEALWSLTSFYRFAEVDWPLRIHGDGSLTDDDVAVLTEHFPQVDVVRRPKANEQMAPVLGQFPVLRELRDRHVFGLRLLDSEHMTTARSRINIDTDVLFFRKPTELLEAALDHDGPCAFNREVGAEGYAVKGAELDAAAGISVPSEINAGLSVLRRGTFQFDELEALLTGAAADWDTYLQEQTLTAVCACRRAGEQGVRFLPATYQCDESPRLVTDAAARHYYILARRQYYTEGLRWLVAEGYEKAWRTAPSAIGGDDA